MPLTTSRTATWAFLMLASVRAEWWPSASVLGNAAAGFGLKAVSLDMDRWGTEACEQMLGLDAVWHQTAVLDMSVGLLDQPLGRIPRARRASTGDTLDAAWRADILHAKADELARWPDFNVEEATAASTARLGALARGSKVVMCGGLHWLKAAAAFRDRR